MIAYLNYYDLETQHYPIVVKVLFCEVVFHDRISGDFSLKFNLSLKGSLGICLYYIYLELGRNALNQWP